MRTPADVVQEQLEAYNARDLDRFAATYSDAIVLGNKVIDHERVRGIQEHPIEAVAVYEVVSGLIETVWFYYPAEPFPIPGDGKA